MSMSRFPRLLALALALVLPGAARAVIVYGGDGKQNTTAPANGAPWERVGIVNGCTGVYLGSVAGKDWVLTANHVPLGSFRLNGRTYSAVNESEARRLASPDGSSADLLLYQIDTDLDLPLLPISSSPLSARTNVTMIGNGYNRESGLTTWYVDGASWSTIPSEGSEETGYYYSSPRSHSLRWGTNTVDYSAEMFDFNHTVCAVTTFDAITGDAQGANGDSGGGVFSQGADGSWRLVGTMVAIGYNYPGEPLDRAVVGDFTLIADLSAYRGQILAAIPEPATVTLWSGLGALGLALWWRRWR